MTTMDGQTHDVGEWDLIIAHPPCTYLSSAGAVRLFDKDHRIKDKAREEKGQQAKAFFMGIINSRCKRICVENPAPMHYWGLPKYTQIVEPYMFGDPWKKRTCLWLKGLKELHPTEIVEPTGCWTIEHGGKTCRVKLRSGKCARSAKERARTFSGIGKAMAEQWGGVEP